MLKKGKLGMKPIKMIGIVDGDVLIYRACHKSIKDNLDVNKTFDDIYEEVKDEIQCDEYSLHVSGHGNFRKKIDQTFIKYKGKRKDKPENFIKCKNYVIKKYKPTSVDLFEADDTASVEATRYLNTGQPYILITVDKDWQMIGGMFYSLMHKYIKPISKSESCEFLHKQLLTGDSVDNIPGIQGIGNIKASKILKGKDLKKQFESIIKTYKKYHPYDYEDRLNCMGKMLFLIKDFKNNSNWDIDYWKRYIKDVQK